MPKQKRKEKREKLKRSRNQSGCQPENFKWKYEEKEYQHSDVSVDEKEVLDKHRYENMSEADTVMVVEMESADGGEKDGDMRKDRTQAAHGSKDFKKDKSQKRRSKSRGSSVERKTGISVESEDAMESAMKGVTQSKDIFGSRSKELRSNRSDWDTSQSKGGRDEDEIRMRHSDDHKMSVQRCSKRSNRKNDKYNADGNRYTRDEVSSSSREEFGRSKNRMSDESYDYRHDDRRRNVYTDSDGSISDQDSGSTTQSILVYRTSNGVLLILSHPQEICLRGKCQLQCLAGTAMILGYQLNAGDQPCDFYSPETNSLLTIQTWVLESDPQKETEVRRIYEENIEENVDIDSLPIHNVVILLAEKLVSNFCNFIESLTYFQSIFSGKSSHRDQHAEENKKLSNVGVRLVSENLKVSRIQISDDYDFIIRKLEKELSTDEAPVIVVCGGKNSGKSTLNRFLVNTIINRHKKVNYLELDVGQTELTPPGCVALHTLDKPLLGPPFCHQERSKSIYYFGGLSPNDNPDRYMAMVKSCFNDYQHKEEKLPLIVNTMGWNKGLGLDLLVDTLRLVRPSLVIQLDFKNLSLNFPPLTADFVKREEGWFIKSRRQRHCKRDESNSDLSSHNLVIVESVRSRQSVDHSGWKPLDHRNLSLLGHLCSNLEPGVSLMSAQPFTVPFCDIAVNICHQVVPPSHILSAINATVVALCCADLNQAKEIDENLPLHFDSTPVCRCVGFGIVRGIDTDKKLLYMITPVDLADLAPVNTLIRGATNLPDEVLLKQRSKNTPYVSITTSSVGSSNLQQRRHLPRKDKNDLRW